MFKFFEDRATLIAEIGGNHEGSINKAKDLMFEAAENGADIVKFQSYSSPGLVNKLLRPDRFKHFESFMLSDDQWVDLAETAVKNKIHGEEVLGIPSKWVYRSLIRTKKHLDKRDEFPIS